MNEDQLARDLQTVGMTCFIKHISVLTDLRIDGADAADHLGKNEAYTKKSNASRVAHARRIVNAGNVREAVEMIAKSKLDDDVVALARHWLTNHL